MHPACLFLIFVLGFVAMWLLVDSPTKPVEYYPSGGTALPPSVRMAARNAGPLPLHSSDLLYPPWNPMANASVPPDWGDVPDEGYVPPMGAGPAPAIRPDQEPIIGDWSWSNPVEEVDLGE